MAKVSAAAAIRRPPDVAPPSSLLPMPPLPGAPPPSSEEDRLARALHDAARPLIALASQLRRAIVDDPEGMKPALADAVQRFERALASAGWDERGISAASYTLCTWIDEVVADTPWGAGGAGLLERFHGERGGTDRLLRLLSHLAERPQENRALLALFHACLSLGLHGHLQDKARQLEKLRKRVFLALPTADLPLSPPWQPAVKPGVPLWRRRLTLGALVLLGLVTLGVYTTSQLLLASQVDEVFASMQRLSPDTRPAPAAAPDVAAAVTEGPARLRPALAGELVNDKRIVVRDETHRSTVSIPADLLFDGGGTRLLSSAAPLLARIGTTLAVHPGKVVVIGHTDGSDRRSARLPSAWHQSYEWARETAAGLEQTLPAHRLAVEGAADQDGPGPDAALPRRRIDIVLYP